MYWGERMAKTLDYRGMEQVCSLQDVLEYAAEHGYDKVLYGYEDIPHIVDKTLHMSPYNRLHPATSEEEQAYYDISNGVMECHNIGKGICLSTSMSVTMHV